MEELRAAAGRGWAEEVLARERAISYVKEGFARFLAGTLGLQRVSSPLFVDAASGMQDDLNGHERPVTFRVSALGDRSYQVVHSLAKWKRYALFRYRVPPGRGIYTDMSALRPDEEDLSTRMHSVFVDQWDWEKVLSPRQRTLKTLQETVEGIYGALKRIEGGVSRRFAIPPCLPDRITFVQAADLAERFPSLTPKERENRVCHEFGAVFLLGIGGELAGGGAHDSRAPDYDDWSTPTVPGRTGLNGDLLVWNPVLNRAFELSSMGIRVDRPALLRQLAIRGCLDRLALPWHRMLLEGLLPDSIGGGIGQSRLCMLLLRCRHIGEVQIGVWPDEPGALN